MGSVETKVCSKCGEIKSVGEFSKNINQCKICKSEYSKEYYAANKQKIATYYEANREGLLTKQKAYNSINKDKVATQKKAYREANKERLATKRKAKYEANRESLITKRKVYYNTNRGSINIKRRSYKRQPAIFSTYASQLSFAEQVNESEEGLLICKCTYCGKTFTPTNSQVGDRIVALNNDNKGEARFYCSENCKKACPIYGRVKYPKGFKKATSREVPAEFRQFALKEKNYTCEKCGSTEDGLHVHHIEGYTEQPMFVADIVNVMVVCKTCHVKIHSQKGCNYNDYHCDVQKVAEKLAA